MPDAAPSAPRVGLRLVEPDPLLHPAWREMWEDWDAEDHQDGSGLTLDADVESPAGFASWVDRLRTEADTSRPVAEGRVHATYWWIARGSSLVGSISLRHELNDYLHAYGGHIGYSVRPSARRRGVARWALGAVLQHARSLGLDRVLVTCADDNVASARTIEVNGGVLEDLRTTPQGHMRRYWIELT